MTGLAGFFKQVLTFARVATVSPPYGALARTLELATPEVSGGPASFDGEGLVSAGWRLVAVDGVRLGRPPRSAATAAIDATTATPRDEARKSYEAAERELDAAAAKSCEAAPGGDGEPNADPRASHHSQRSGHRTPTSAGGVALDGPARARAAILRAWARCAARGGGDARGAGVLLQFERDLAAGFEIAAEHTAEIDLLAFYRARRYGGAYGARTTWKKPPVQPRDAAGRSSTVAAPSYHDRHLFDSFCTGNTTPRARHGGGDDTKTNCNSPVELVSYSEPAFKPGPFEAIAGEIDGGGDNDDDVADGDSLLQATLRRHACGGASLHAYTGRSAVSRVSASLCVSRLPSTGNPPSNSASPRLSRSQPSDQGDEDSQISLSQRSRTVAMTLRMQCGARALFEALCIDWCLAAGREDEVACVAPRGLGALARVARGWRVVDVDGKPLLEDGTGGERHQGPSPKSGGVGGASRALSLLKQGGAFAQGHIAARRRLAERLSGRSRAALRFVTPPTVRSLLATPATCAAERVAKARALEDRARASGGGVESGDGPPPRRTTADSAFSVGNASVFSQLSTTSNANRVEDAAHGAVADTVRYAASRERGGVAPGWRVRRVNGEELTSSPVARPRSPCGSALFGPAADESAWRRRINARGRVRNAGRLRRAFALGELARSDDLSDSAERLVLLALCSCASVLPLRGSCVRACVHAQVCVSPPGLCAWEMPTL